MQEEAPDPRSAREAELVEVLSSYVEPRAVSYRFVIGFVLVGLVGCVSVAWAASQAPIHAPVRFEPQAQQNLEQGVRAFERGDWDESERLLLAARESGQVAPQRLEDYLERLLLVRRDSDRLLRAEEALEVGEPERALALTTLIASNSAFFAQAEVLSRAARARAAELAAQKLAAKLDAEAARQASHAGVEARGPGHEQNTARTLVPASTVVPSHAHAARRHAPLPTGKNPEHGTDADW